MCAKCILKLMCVYSIFVYIRLGKSYGTSEALHCVCVYISLVVSLSTTEQPGMCSLKHTALTSVVFRILKGRYPGVYFRCIFTKVFKSLHNFFHIKYLYKKIFTSKWGPR